MYVEAYFNTNNQSWFFFIPSIIISLLQYFEDDIGQSNSNLSVICVIAQVYTNKHNCLSAYQIKLKYCQKLSKIFLYANKPWRLPKLVVKDQNDKWKRWKANMYKIDNICNPILIDKKPIWWKYFYLR